MIFKTANECYKEGQTAKEFFKDTTILADDVIYELHTDFVRFMIDAFQPRSAFEFGCGRAKNLALLKGFHGGKVKKVMGIDISQGAIYLAHKDGRGQSDDFIVELGDESYLKTMKSNSFDVCFTCSVLDHIPTEEQAKSIIEELKRISKKGVLLAETLADKPDWYYYPHDYEGMGFCRMPSDYEWKSPVDSNTYHTWMWFKD